MNVVYIFKGLGSDISKFDHLELEPFKIKYIEWLSISENETLYSYVKKLKNQIIDESPIFLGFSFGGIVAIEMSKLITPSLIFLVSSIKSKKELPFFYKLIVKLRLYKLMSFKILHLYKRIKRTNYSYKDDCLLAKDDKFLRWGLKEFSNWNCQCCPENVIQIHGKKDKFLPFKLINGIDHLLNDGHFLFKKNTNSISLLIQKHINSLV